VSGFFGPSSLGGGDPSMQGGGDFQATLQRLLQQFPGLTSLQAPNMGQGITTSSLGFGSPGVDLYSGQPSSAGGLFGSTGTGIFEGASAGQPESVTGGLSSGYLGKSPSQAPLANTGQPGTSAQGNTVSPAGAGPGQFNSLAAPSFTGFGTETGPVTDQNLLGAPAQSYDLLGPVKQVVGGQQIGSAFSGAPPSGQSFATPSTTFGGGFDTSPSGTVSPGDLTNTPGVSGFGAGATAPHLTGEMGDVIPGSTGGGGASTLGQITGGLGGILGGLQLAQGIQSKNPLAAIQGAYGLYSGVNSALDLGLPTLSSLGSQVAQSAAEAGASAAGGAIMGGIGAIPDVWEAANTFLPGLLNPGLARQETEGIRRDFGTAWPAYEGTPATLADIAGTHDPAALQRQLQTANYQLAQAPAVSRWLSSRGGEKHTLYYDAPALDTSQQSAVSPTYSMDAVLANTLAQDRLAQQGVTPDLGPQGLNVSDVWSNPQAMLGGLWGAAGMDPGNPLEHSFWNSGGAPQQIYNPDTQMYEEHTTPWQLSPEQAAAFAHPGNRMQAIQQLFSQLNPNFSQSPLAATLAYLQGQPGA